MSINKTADVSKDLVAVIMAGGAGTRFWPLSTEEMPKQFLRLFGDRSLIRMSFERIAGMVPPDRVLVLTNARFVHLVKEHLPEVPAQNVIGEPSRRDTAAAVALAAAICRKRHGNKVMAVLTADHIIEPVANFRNALASAAAAAASSGALYTLGIPPTWPSTGYGYLETGDRVLSDQGLDHFALARFKEKPDAATAASYVDSGRFLWNSGMFVWTVDAIEAEFARQLPGYLDAMKTAAQADKTAAFADALSHAFDSVKPLSVDYGVMEHAREVRCVKADFAWSDVGGWAALRDHLPKDAASNAFRGVIEQTMSSCNTVFCADESETVALVGVEGLVVVRAGRTTLVARADAAERIKDLVRSMSERKP